MSASLQYAAKRLREIADDIEAEKRSPILTALFLAQRENGALTFEQLGPEAYHPETAALIARAKEAIDWRLSGMGDA